PESCHFCQFYQLWQACHFCQLYRFSQIWRIWLKTKLDCSEVVPNHAISASFTSSGRLAISASSTDSAKYG
ncbi:hypothetical protein, partial [Pseudomonas sp.]|uniref:hypothetical protein n=1 Tax=Pseudomonas sp. TaxID=306 RepID=UPI0028A86F23